MKNMYIFDEAANSSQNGIGTYIAELKRHLRDVVRVNVLSFNDTVSSFRKEYVDGVTCYRFPVFCGGAVLNNPETASAVIRLEIPDAPGNVFLLNYFLCIGLQQGLAGQFVCRLMEQDCRSSPILQPIAEKSDVRTECFANGIFIVGTDECKRMMELSH